MINSNLPHILHRFRDIASKRSKIATFSTLLCFTPPPWRRGSPGTISVKFLPKGHMAKVPNGVETLPKISIAWVGCTNVTDDRQTDRRTDGRRQFTFAKKVATGNTILYPCEICHRPTLSTVLCSCIMLCSRERECRSVTYLFFYQRCETLQRNVNKYLVSRSDLFFCMLFFSFCCISFQH